MSRLLSFLAQCAPNLTTSQRCKYCRGEVKAAEDSEALRQTLGVLKNIASHYNFTLLLESSSCGLELMY